MLFSLFVSSAVALVSLGSPDVAGEQRMPTAMAMNEMGKEACSRVYATDAERVLACREEHFSAFPETDARLFNDGDDDDRACIEAGGMWVEKMPGCIDALAALVKASDEDTALSMSNFFSLFGGFIDKCSAKTMCGVPEARS